MSGGGVNNRQVALDALIASGKILFDPTNADYQSHGLPAVTLGAGVKPTATQLGVPELVEGTLIWHVTDQVFYVYGTGSTWVAINPGSGASVTLDGAYTNGATIAITDGNPIAITNADDNTDTFNITNSHATGTGDGVQITLSGATYAGHAVNVDISGATSAANGLDVNISQAGATGHCLNLASSSSTGKLINSSTFTVTPSGTMALSGDFSCVGGATIGSNTSMGGDLNMNSNNISGVNNLTVTGTLSATVAYADSVPLNIGAGADIVIISDGTNGHIYSTADNQAIYVGNDGVVSTNATDLTIYGDTNAASLALDASANKYTITGIEMILTDNTAITFGTGEDASLKWDGTDLDLTFAADGSIFKIGNGTNDCDLWWYAGSNTVVFDEGAATATFNGVDIHLLDDDVIGFGDSQDVTMTYASGTSALTVLAAAGDQAVVVGADGANELVLTWHGSTAGSDFIIDATNDALKLDGMNLMLEDTDKIILGDDSDFTITGTSSAMSIYCAQDNDVLTIGWQTGAEFDLDVAIRGNAAANYALFDASANSLDLTNNIALQLFTTTPANAGDTGTAGTITYDASYIYIATGTDTWKRVAIASW